MELVTHSVVCVWSSSWQSSDLRIGRALLGFGEQQEGRRRPLPLARRIVRNVSRAELLPFLKIGTYLPKRIIDIQTQTISQTQALKLPSMCRIKYSDGHI